MCIACKLYGRKFISNEGLLKKALSGLEELYLHADDEMLLHLDDLTTRWMSDKPERFRDMEADELWERNHR